jgi:hypothetical protein
MKNTISESKSLNGHWHLSRTGVNNRIYWKLEVIGDSIAEIEGVSVTEFDNGKMIFHDSIANIKPESKTMFLWIDGAYEEFKYQFLRDTIKLESKNDNDMLADYVGIRVDEEQCDNELEFFSTNLVSIDLPKIEKTDTIVDIDQSSLYFLNIYYGLNKEINYPALEINSREINLDDIKLEIEKFKLKLPSNRETQTGLVLNLDKSLAGSFRNECFENFLTEGFTVILQRKIKRDSKIVLVKNQFLK